MIIRLSQVEVGVTDLDRAADFYERVLGFRTHLHTDDAVYLRGTDEFDVWSLKLAERVGPGMVSFGFRVSSSEYLDTLADLHEELGLEDTRLPAGFEPGRGEGLRVRRPEGYVIDYHHEIEEIDPYDQQGRVSFPMRQPGVHAGVSPRELDHVNYRHPGFRETYDYFVGRLDFTPAEMVMDEDGEIRGSWVRRTRTTHDVAIRRHEVPGFHHFCYSVADVGALFRAADLLADNGYSENLQYGPGRHGVSGAMAMYFLDPDGNRIELNTGDMHRDLDRPPLRWEYQDFMDRGRFWWGTPPAQGWTDQTPFLEAEFPSRI